jgi:steroid delta-isomerase-like uncharacterized protein
VPLLEGMRESMTRARNEECLRAHLAAENAHDMDATLATLHPDCVFLDEPIGRRYEGRDGAYEYYVSWWSAFGNTIERGELHWPRDDLAIGDAAFVGRHVGTFAGIEATGAPMRLPFVVFVEFREGLIVGETFVYDLNGLLRQLGQPAFAPAPSRS